MPEIEEDEIIVEEFEAAIRQRINLDGVRVFSTLPSPNSPENMYRVEIVFGARVPVTRAMLRDTLGTPNIADVTARDLRHRLLSFIDDWRKQVVNA